MTLIEKLFLAIEVIKRWEVLVTLGVFIIFWALMRYIANPWRKPKAPKAKISIKKAPKAKEVVASTESDESGEDDNSENDDSNDE